MSEFDALTPLQKAYVWCKQVETLNNNEPDTISLSPAYQEGRE